MTTYTYTFLDETYEVVLIKNRYAMGGRVRLDFQTPQGEPIATATVNLPELALEPGEVFIKTWSENENMLPFLIANGIVEPTGKRVNPTPYVTAEICRLLL